jgi:uncharacterized repeat protein (TIGR01451 family)
LDILDADPAGDPIDPATSNNNCKEINITWEAGSGLQPDMFRVFRSFTAGGPWNTQIGGNVPYNGPGPYTVTDSGASTSSPNYYAIFAYRGNTASNPALTLPTIARACAPNLSGSDKELITVDTIPSFGPVPAACNGLTQERYTGNTTLYKPGQIVEFKLCVSNISGEATLRNPTVTDIPQNVTISSVSFGAINGVTCGTANSNTQYSLIDIPVSKSCSITITGSIAIPANAGSIERFGNEAFIIGNGNPGDPSVSTTVSSGLYNFSAVKNAPSRNETAP